MLQRVSGLLVDHAAVEIVRREDQHVAVRHVAPDDVLLDVLVQLVHALAFVTRESRIDGFGFCARQNEHRFGLVAIDQRQPLDDLERRLAAERIGMDGQQRGVVARAAGSTS